MTAPKARLKTKLMGLNYTFSSQLFNYQILKNLYKIPLQPLLGGKRNAQENVDFRSLFELCQLFIEHIQKKFGCGQINCGLIL